MITYPNRGRSLRDGVHTVLPSATPLRRGWRIAGPYGFAHAIAAGADDETVLRTANTCGKLNAMDPMTGHLVMDRWDEVYNGVVVTEL